MKHILVATDLSPHADRAVDRGMRLAQRLEAKLTLLHAVDSTLPGTILGMHRREAAEILREAARQGSAHVEAVPLVVAGDPWSVIVESAARVKADLLVMGVHHKKKLRDMFRGTTSERVIRSVGVPVLVAARPGRSNYRGVVVGVDFSEAAKRAFHAAVALHPQGTVTAVHAYDVVLPDMSFLSMRDATRVRHTVLAEAADRAGAELDVWLGRKQDVRKVRKSIVQGDAAVCLRAAVNRTRADLLAIGTRGLGTAHRLLTGSVSAGLLGDAPCDVLVTSGRGA
ncbi:MAG: universal stress protein [Candidatus Binatia bacterium]